MLIHRSPALEALCYLIKKLGHSSVLDLGHAGSGCINLFGSLHCRLQIEDLNRYIKTGILTRPKSDYDPVNEVVSGLSSETQYDVVMMWDLVNYMQLDELSGLFHKLRDCSKPNTLVHCLYYTSDLIPKVPRKINVRDNQYIELSPYPVRKRDIPLSGENEFLNSLPKGVSVRSYSQRFSMLPSVKDYLIKIS